MKTCPTCQHPLEDTQSFCPICGTNVTAVPSTVSIFDPPVNTAPPAPQPVPVPVQPAPMPTAQPSKAKAIVGMIMSISGLVMSGFGVFFELIFTAFVILEMEVEVAGLFGIIYGFLFLAFSLPLTLVGLTLSRKSIAAGNTMSIARIGKTLCVVSLILCGVTLFFTFLCIGLYAAYM